MELEEERLCVVLSPRFSLTVGTVPTSLPPTMIGDMPAVPPDESPLAWLSDSEY